MRRIAIAASVLAAVPLVVIGVAQAAPIGSTAVTIDGRQGGRTFDGVGAISGGGGNSRLLVDYPEPQRSQILDYLFKPGYGAALQILKVEIGGDTNSTDGAEPSHMHTRTDLNCDRGYEWWLMEQAKARNPAIKLAALSWGAPGWVGGPAHTFWTQDTITYLIKWLGCAKQHNLSIDYIGGWNERGHDKTWYENVHKALSANHFSTKLVGDDSKGWSTATDMAADPAFNAAVDVVGTHYPCGYQGTDKGKKCSNSDVARGLGKPLWASETGSQDYNTGAFATARSLNRGYLDARMTGFLNWPLVAAITPNLKWSTTGLVLANQPWAGSYAVGTQVWAIAQATQFTAPGWTYVDSASGYLGGDRANGSYVTLKAPGRKDYSTIVETLDATAAQTLSVRVVGGLPTGTVHVWATNLNSTNASDHLVHVGDVTPVRDRYTVTLKPGFVYTLTTTTGQGKGTAHGKANATMALPYKDSFDGYAMGREARYLADMDGAFETVRCGGSRAGTCVRQMAPQEPVEWRAGARDPSALLGDVGWTDYTVRVDVLLEQPGYVELLGRVGAQGGTPAQLDAFVLRVTDRGGWSLLKAKNPATPLASGAVTPLGTNRWHTMSLSFKGSTITAAIDGGTVGTVTNTSYPAGQIGIATSQTIPVQFDNLSVT
jgi:glycosyl hydrolase family 59/glycosyl hydrolase family 59 (putative galactocerebrosidase)